MRRESGKRTVAGPTRRQALVGAAASVAALALGARRAIAGAAPAGDQISKSEEAIHQEVDFKAPRHRVYEVLTDTKLFDRLVGLSAAMQGGRPPGAAATAIGKEAGAPFTAFGGHISGRQVELVPDERIVQAWRASNWDAGKYSIASFVLSEKDGVTHLVFDHTGFPRGDSDTLAAGWKSNYWEPLAKVLA